MKLPHFLARYKSFSWVIALVCGAYFFVISFLIFGNTTPLFSWPDEMANYFFISHFTDGISLRVPEALDQVARNIILPRSITMIDGALVPVGFLGIPIIYGVLFSFLKQYVLFVTPLVISIALYVWYITIKKLYSTRIALISFLLLATLPSFLYFSHFSLLPSVVFLALLILAWGSFVSGLHKSSMMILSGVLVGLALMIRPIEIVWTLPIVLLFFSYYRRQLTIKKCFAFCLPIIVLGIVYLFFNYQTYGSLFAMGYGNVISQSQPLAEPVATYQLSWWQGIGTVLSNILTFIIPTHWHVLILGLFGIVTLLYATSKKEIVYYFTGIVVIKIALAIMYGMYYFPDEFTKQISVLGVSYNRYFLPFFIALIIPSAIFLDRLSKKSKIALASIISLVIVIVIINIRMVYVSGNDSIPRIQESLMQQQTLHDKILKLTPDNAVIYTKRGDKIIFPERKVIAQIDENDLSGFHALLESGVPLYLLSYADEFRSRQISEFSLQNEQSLGYNYTLYEITAR